MSIAFKQLLSGKHAFYNAPDFYEKGKAELSSSEPVKPVYKTEIENKVWRVVKDILAVLFLPYGIYRLTHMLAAKVAFLPASTPALMGITQEDLNAERKNALNDHQWKVKRISIEVDGYTIDAAIMGKASTLGNGRWMLASNGNGEFYEHKLQDWSFKHILSEVESNAIIFNYPGVGSSSGMPSKSAMTKAYQAVLRFLEDQNEGIGAKEIIGYGHSIGGGAQGEALLTHELKEDIKYVFVKSRTFSDLSTVASEMLGSPLIGFLVKVFGWNMSSVESSKGLKAPEIIMQAAAHAWRSATYITDLTEAPDSIVHDGVISAEASLAKKLLEDGKEYPNKYFMGIMEDHNSGLSTSVGPLAGKIKEMLAG